MVAHFLRYVQKSISKLGSWLASTGAAAGAPLHRGLEAAALRPKCASGP